MTPSFTRNLGSYSSKHRRPHRWARLCLEMLESRDQPSAVPDLATVESAFGQATLELRATGFLFDQVESMPTPSVLAAPPYLPYGMVAYHISGVTPGAITSVDLNMPEGSSFDGYYKQDPATGWLSRFDFDGQTGAVVNGNIVTLYLQDGGRGDDDGVANGVIVDPGGPGSDPPPGDPPPGDPPPGGPNQPPVAVADSYTVVHDRVLYKNVANGVLANDSDPNDDPMQAIFVTQPANGSLAVQDGKKTPVGSGAFTYIPNAGFVGTDTFTYFATDGVYNTSATTVTITVTNQVPVGGSDAYSGPED
jgi:Bacterial Ig domain